MEYMIYRMASVLVEINVEKRRWLFSLTNGNLLVTKVY
jgi:hypothetical protein